MVSGLVQGSEVSGVKLVSTVTITMNITHHYYYYYLELGCRAKFLA